jgi:hypothetical protein
MTAPDALIRSWIAAEAAQPIGAAPTALVEAIVNRHGHPVAAVLFYGSCLRRPEPAQGQGLGDDPVFDFYVLVDRYRDAYRGSLAALANYLLPPNVFYIEHPWQGRRLRAKYAIVSLAQFRRRVSRRGFHSYFWARFTQPVRLPYARDEAVRIAVDDALATAIVTMVANSVGLLGDSFDARELWTRGFEATYGAELRAEGSDRAGHIYEADRARYDRLTGPALVAAGIVAEQDPATGRFRRAAVSSQQASTIIWGLRRALGKVLSMLRLVKGVFTFDGGLDYILWKIERHSGVTTSVTPWQRRHPLLAAPSVAWRLYRQGAFR